MLDHRAQPQPLADAEFVGELPDDPAIGGLGIERHLALPHTDLPHADRRIGVGRTRQRCRQYPEIARAKRQLRRGAVEPSRLREHRLWRVAGLYPADANGDGMADIADRAGLRVGVTGAGESDRQQQRNPQRANRPEHCFGYAFAAPTNG